MTRGFTSYPFQGFGKGLNLLDKPDAVDPAECIDVLNCTFTDRGAIEQRPGYDNLTGALTNRVESLEAFYTSGGTKQLLAGCGTRLEAISTGGTIVASATGLSNAGPHDFARFGGPNTETAFAGNGTDTIRKWNGTEWTAPTATVNGEAGKAMPKAGFLCVQSPDNRLVATGFDTTTGGPNGATSSPSHVYFSNAGEPEHWETTGTTEHPNNSIQLTPGDGEAIQGCIAWQNFVFVFKESKFFVFYGNSVDGSGDPIFNYRPVDNGIGCVSPRTICADRNGVYFMGRLGVYRTTGQNPELISRPVEPIWTGDASAFYTGGVLAHSAITACAATIHEEQLYLAFPTESTNNRILVYDPRAEWWSLYNIPASALTPFRIGAQAELAFGYATGAKEIGRYGPSFTNDDGSAIESHWRSGWFDLSNPDVKTLAASKVWGTGKVSYGLGHDFYSGNGTTDILNLTDTTSTQWNESTWGGGTWAEPRGLIQKRRRRAVRGTTFSVYFTNVALNQPWSVHRIDHLLRETRKPSTVDA
jgi:hypothetical protein